MWKAVCSERPGHGFPWWRRPSPGGGDQVEAGQDEAAGDGPAEVGAGEASPGDVSPTVVGVDEAGLPGGPSGAKVGLVGTG